VLPVIEGLVAATVVPLSVDTTKASVAEAALAAGAMIVNDVSAGRADPDLLGVVARNGAGYVAMHMQGEPRTMQKDPRYDDVVDDVRAFLEGRAAFAVARGVPPERIQVDPGIGFGKSLEHNVTLLRRLDEIAALGFPVVVGVSRKAFLGALTGREVAADRVAATVAANVIAYERGARVFRVHDVPATVDGLKVAAGTLPGDDA
jgi:dihydropteroate synthase